MIPWDELGTLFIKYPIQMGLAAIPVVIMTTCLIVATIWIFPRRN